MKGVIFNHDSILGDKLAIEELDRTKQDTLTFDSTPTAGSSNPVTSGGVKSALDNTAPANHASSGTNYGVGTGNNYGHLKLSDSSTSTSSTSSGIAATPQAVKTVNDRLTYGSTDLTAGTSALTTGVFYAYYT